MAHFNRERIPERVVHAKGAGIKTNKQAIRLKRDYFQNQMHFI